MTLQEFIASGIIGPIGLGLSKREVQSILGDAQAKSERRKGRELWKYEDLQVGFYQDVVHFIGMYVSDDSIKLPLPLVFDEQVLAQIMRLEDTKRFLLANEMEFDINDKLTFDDQTCLRIVGVTGSEAHLVFTGERLYSIQIAEHSD
jgi:hypothetical protein